MNKCLKIAIVQSSIIWHKAEQNLINYSEKINSISETVDVVVLPEMFSTGFTMKPVEVAEEINGDTVIWMQNTASKQGFAICGSIVIKEEGKYYNRFVFVFPSGEIQYYNKRHLFSLAGEEKVYTAGKQKVIINYKGWKICPQVCYDLRFPVFSRNTTNYDLLLYVANWPKPRILAWDSLLKARSIENMCYTVGVNRVGKDENGYEFTGHSAVYNCLGKQISISKYENEFIEVVEVTKNHISEVRNKFNFLNDKDEFKLLL
ncbi:amidohydrolase [Lutibacter sp. TH_r2]|uniref:amidohydrolase n=1 Tax=Lutibacter sp. TH_r2 TaxID=3082083 RepID=UPI0029546347|nr:amidohydrolase [Lutibacter sp. TH_r2]MDV7186775.1 amidohydrolase [Lutibacter sp. TH_r2]